MYNAPKWLYLVFAFVYCAVVSRSSHFLRHKYAEVFTVILGVCLDSSTEISHYMIFWKWCNHATTRSVCIVRCVLCALLVFYVGSGTHRYRLSLTSIYAAMVLFLSLRFLLQMTCFIFFHLCFQFRSFHSYLSKFEINWHDSNSDMARDYSYRCGRLQFMIMNTVAVTSLLHRFLMHIHIILDNIL